MSYDPQSGGSNQPPDESQGGYRASEGSPTMPTGGYTPPPSEPSGGYTPPAGGGPTQPVGGYTPAPPAGGGYSAPPPPPPPGPVMRSEGGGAFDINSLFQSWMNALTKPNVATYEAEIPRANWTSTLIGVAIVALVSALVALLSLGASRAMMDQLTPLFQQQDPNFDPSVFNQVYGGAGAGGAVTAFIGTFISFFLGAGVLWLAARMLGGTGSDFMTHSYLLSISYTPTRVIAALIGIIPVVGGLIGLVLYFYQLYLAGLSMQASQRMVPGRAQMAAFLPTIIGIVLGGLCCVLALGTVMAMLSGLAGNQ